MPVAPDPAVAPASRFLALHRPGRPLVVPNPWDAGSAVLLGALGFEALATTGAGYAFASGRTDGTIGRTEMLGHLRTIVAVTALPVTADLEDGFGTEPETVAETIALAAATGVVGGSVEDRSYGPDHRGLFDLGLAVERVEAAVDAARATRHGMAITARCENHLVGDGDLAETIRRLQAYQEAGADVLYAPGLADLAAIASLVASVDRPVNVVAGLGPDTPGVEALADAGVARISLGSTLARVALGAIVQAVEELRATGTFGFADRAISYHRITEVLRDRPHGSCEPSPVP